MCEAIKETHLVAFIAKLWIVMQEWGNQTNGPGEGPVIVEFHYSRTDKKMTLEKQAARC